MNELLEKIKEIIMPLWGKMSKAQKIIVGISAVSFLLFMVLFSALSSRVKYEPLFTNLEPKDAAMIKAQLDKMGVQYNISSNGSVIEVDAKRKHSLRLDLANNGAIPTGGKVGFEIFDNTKLTVTEFDKKIMFLRAQKGEIEKTITSLQQVKTAVVNITPANDSVFAEEKTMAKASILIGMEPFEKLSDENIKSIMVLIASAVEGLTTDNIQVVDSEGNILSERVEFETTSTGINTRKLALQKEIEKQLEKNASGVLSVLGGGNYKVKVAVELDFNKELIDKEEYTTPTVSGEQMTEGLIRSQQENIENYKGKAGESPEGVAGTSSNIPGYTGVEDKNTAKEYNKANNIKNYEIDKKMTKYEKATGSIKKITVSVVLNQKSSHFKDKDFTAADKKEFENMVKNAVNLNETRGDTINVTAIPFDTEFIDQFKQKEEEDARLRKNLIISAVVFILIIIIAAGVIMLMRRVEEKKLREKERLAVEELIPEFESVALGEQLSVEEQERKEQEDNIKAIAKQKPEDVANLIRSWMLDD